MQTIVVKLELANSVQACSFTTERILVVTKTKQKHSKVWPPLTVALDML